MLMIIQVCKLNIHRACEVKAQQNIDCVRDAYRNQEAIDAAAAAVAKEGVANATEEAAKTIVANMVRKEREQGRETGRASSGLSWLEACATSYARVHLSFCLPIHTLSSLFARSPATRAHTKPHGHT